MQTALVSETLRPTLSVNPDLDYLLAEVAEAVQLTNTQYGKATDHYEAVARWLEADGSPLAGLSLRIYPQGSMALETTVKPLGDVEYDLDLVCQVSHFWGSAMDLYAKVHARLADHETYRSMLSKKKRCVRLDYQGEFHLDIIPAVPDAMRGDTSILVPDRELGGWTPSNPKGFVKWFKSQSALRLVEKTARTDAEPLPALREADEKPPLAIAVQLLKRARDVMFDGSDAAPRSIMISTLAGHHYRGGRCVATSMHEVLDGIQRQIRMAAPYTIEVKNPTNSGENFTDSLTPERYAALIEYVRSLGSAIDKLRATRGIGPLRSALENLFGVKPVSTAIEKYGRLLESQRRSHELTYSSAGLGVVTAVAQPKVPRNTYFGD
ncbi:nucleotidyltransferase [Pyxidicoccus sp. 3LFB2]